MASSLLPDSVESTFQKYNKDSYYPGLESPDSDNKLRIFSDDISNASTNGVYGRVMKWKEQDCLVYTTVRTRHGKQFFHKYNGFAISSEVLHTLDEKDITTIFIGAKDTRDVWEFQTEDYLSGFEVSYQDTQKVLSLEESKSIWRNSFLHIFEN